MHHSKLLSCSGCIAQPPVLFCILVEIPRVSILIDGSTDTTVGKDLQKQAMRNASVQDMDTGYAIFNRVDAVLQLRQHAAAQASAVYKILCLFYGHFGN